MRTVELAVGEYYHIFNRGVDKRPIFTDERDRDRFLQTMRVFNDVDTPVGGLRTQLWGEQFGQQMTPRKPLVNIICYCINPNHYHFLLEQVAEAGVERFMHRIGTGYTKYFNAKHQRVGSLFQGPFKAIRVDSDAYLLHVSAYINLNMRVHRLGSRASRSSWLEYIATAGTFTEGIVKPDIILQQFSSPEDYRRFAQDALREILARRGVADVLLEQTIGCEV